MKMARIVAFLLALAGMGILAPTGGPRTLLSRLHRPAFSGMDAGSNSNHWARRAKL